MEVHRNLRWGVIFYPVHPGNEAPGRSPQGRGWCPRGIFGDGGVYRIWGCGANSPHIIYKIKSISPIPDCEEPKKNGGN